MLKNLTEYNAYAATLRALLEKHLSDIRELIALDHAIAFLERSSHDEEYTRQHQCIGRSE